MPVVSGSRKRQSSNDAFPGEGSIMAHASNYLGDALEILAERVKAGKVDRRELLGLGALLAA